METSIPRLDTKIMLESNRLTSRILVLRLAVARERRQNTIRHSQVVVYEVVVWQRLHNVYFNICLG